ncbi:acyltransferase family protein [Garicola koreensis]|uniref:Fucose 4-O-acetylase-like acetyltransferase n=1 Tax=Garicola koreensis TaxID=1262554 RepID=A0A7W5TQ70_9MICC|nr:fucose 4-O-acetylase-like acetyltransferase [Garicola koreensis]
MGIDLLRVVSVAAVVVGHAWPFMPGEEYLQIWRMPLFFFLSGYFLSSSRRFGGELRTRWRTLGVPYLVWLVLLTGLVIAHHFTPRPFENTWETVGGALVGGAETDMPFLAFWFISVLFFAALLVRLVLPLPWWVHLVVAVAGLSLAQVPDSAMSYTPLGIGLAPACAAYILAGFWFRRLLSTTRMSTLMTPRAAGVGLPLIIAGFGGVALGAATMNMKWSGFGTFLLSPMLAVLICIGLVLIFGTWVDSVLRAVPRAGRTVSALVSTGTLVVFLHPYVLFLARDAVPNPPVLILIALLLCWALGLLVNRTRLSPYLTGLPRPPKPSSAAAPS